MHNTMTTPALTPVSAPKLQRGIVKQILSGDSVVIRQLTGTPPLEKTLSLSGITAPKLARRPGESSGETKDEPGAWEAREFLRKKLIKQEVVFLGEKPPNANREYGSIYIGKDIATGENITESLVAEGLVTVRRENVKATPELTKLWELEDEAKRLGKGKWGSNQPSIRDIKWTIDNPSAFIEKNTDVKFKAIIEHVRDGSTVRAFLLPDYYYVTVMMAGIRCDSEENLAKHAKYLVENRLLQQDVEIVLYAANNTNFTGSVIHPKGNIAEFLLVEGFAKCVDRSIVNLPKEEIQKLRAAENQAKTKRLRVWKDFQARTPQVTGKEKEFTATVLEIINGDALQLKLANGTYKKVFLSNIRAPRDAARQEDEDGRPAPRPKGFRPLYDIPWMFQAREHLRTKLIGKKVNVVIDYIQEARDTFPEKTSATILFNGKNVAEALVANGFATVIKYKQGQEDEKGGSYDELIQAERKAEKSQVGLHSRKDAGSQRITELDAKRAKGEADFLRNRHDKIEVIVEFVASGSRFRLYFPKSNYLATFLLSGINCPRAARPAFGNQPASDGEEFGNEALQFVKEKCLQRSVLVKVETSDKAGNFIGWMFVDNANLSIELVRAGYASVNFIGEKSTYATQLKQAEDEAKSLKLLRWRNYVEEPPQEKPVEDETPVGRKINYEEVVVTEVTNEGTFFVQRTADGSKAEALFAKLRQEFEANSPLPGAYNPKRGDICAAKFTLDDAWYRAKVEKVASGKAEVLYIDYGNRETLPTTRLASLPAAYSSDPPFATEYSMPYVQLAKDDEYKEMALKYFREDTAASSLYLNVEFRAQGQLPSATLHKDQSGDTDIVKGLISEGLLLLPVIKSRRQNKLLEDYRAAQDEARKAHNNIWEYGDVTEDDAKEFGLGKCK